MIRRGVEPSRGKWSIPGGAIELGEEAEQALRREVSEETGLIVEPLEIIGVYDSIVRSHGTIQYHYTLVDYLCRYISGDLRGSSDAMEARWVNIEDLDEYDMTSTAPRAIARGVKISRSCSHREHT